MMRVFLIIILICLNTMLLPSKDDDAVIVRIGDIRPEQVVMKGFTLDRDIEVEIDATVGIIRQNEQPLSACWFLDSDSRKLIWECSFENSKVSGHGKELRCRERMKLSRGNYEAYYALNPSPSKKIIDIGDFLNFLLGEFDDDKQFEAWGLTIRPVNSGKATGHYRNYFPVKSNRAIVQHVRLQDDESIKEGFSISQPLKVRIYAIGEGSRKRRQMYDYGWIVDANTRERLWEMTYRNTDHAGGADKNLRFDAELMLPAGDYFVYFITDDSHSTEKWNQLCPYDPFYWGISIHAVEETYSREAVTEYKRNVSEPIIEMTHIRNDQYEMEGFYIEKGSNFNICAVGEYSRSHDDFVDGAWIMDAHSRNIVWKMDYYNTQHAGGARKNRMYDGDIYLPAGAYLVFYESDDSHAYKHWNERKPFQPEKWGITISAVGKDISREDMKGYYEYRDRRIMAQIIEVGNREKLNADFYLPRDTEIRIYAIGEGDRSEMYDYAWIENNRGRIVWEMEYSKTKTAGGAKKNRVVNELIKLDKGTYRVFYKTDGSHAYRRWNSTPPKDQIHWGVTIIKND